MNNTLIVRKVLIVTLILNLMVSVMKLCAGWYFRSVSIIADGFHSFFDATSNVIGLIGIRAVALPPDDSHPYGHKKYETIAALGIGVMLFLTCFEVLKRAYESFTHGAPPAVANWVSFAVMFITMGVNFFVASYEAKKGRECRSEFLMADAAHTRSDVLASTSVILGMVAVRMGYPVADPIVAVVIAFLIAHVGYGIIKNSSETLCDAARIKAAEVEALCLGVAGVIRCHQIRSRGREDEICIDLRIHVSPYISTSEAHEIATEVEQVIMKNIAGVSDVVVHVEPEE